MIESAITMTRRGPSAAGTESLIRTADCSITLSLVADAFVQQVSGPPRGAGVLRLGPLHDRAPLKSHGGDTRGPRAFGMWPGSYAASASCPSSRAQRKENNYDDQNSR